MSKFKLFLATLILTSTAFGLDVVGSVSASSAEEVEMEMSAEKQIFENAKYDAVQFLLSPEETKVPTPALEAAMKLVQWERDNQNLPQASAVELAVEVLERASAQQQ